MKMKMKNAALALTLALFSAPATHAADGPDFEETIVFLNSYLSPSLSIEATGAYNIKIQDSILSYEADMVDLDPNYSLSETSGVVHLRCKGERKCYSVYGITDGGLRFHAESKLLGMPIANVDAARKALDHIFNDLLPKDPFAN